MRRLHRTRSGAALLAALAHHMPEGTRWTQPAGGNAVWLTLPAGTDARALAARAQDAGVAYTQGDAFFLDAAGARHLHLCFAPLEPSQIEEGIARLGQLVRVTR